VAYAAVMKSGAWRRRQKGRKKIMAKVTMPLMSAIASGRFGAFVFDKRGHVRVFKAPANPNSAGQQTHRGRMGDIQREVKVIGSTLRAACASGLGYHWNALIVQDLLNNNAAKWISLAASYNAFQVGEKSAWATADVATGNVNADGLVLFLVATALYDISSRLTGSGLVTQPSSSNAGTVGAEWIA